MEKTAILKCFRHKKCLKSLFFYKFFSSRQYWWNIVEISRSGKPLIAKWGFRKRKTINHQLPGLFLRVSSLPIVSSLALIFISISLDFFCFGIRVTLFDFFFKLSEVERSEYNFRFKQQIARFRVWQLALSLSLPSQFL